MKGDILSVKDTVENVLKEDERSRDDDKYLILTVLRKMGFEVFIPYKKMESMPSFESITRCRRKLQESGLYPPSPKTDDERKEEEKKMRTIESWF